MGYLPRATFQNQFGSFWAAFELQNGAKIATSFEVTFGPKANPRINLKTGPELDPKGAPKESFPTWIKVRGYAAISSLWHTL